VIPLFVIPQEVVADFQVAKNKHQLFTSYLTFKCFSKTRSQNVKERNTKKKEKLLWQEVKYYIGDNKKFTIYFT
jgi:hypothetical protein